MIEGIAIATPVYTLADTWQANVIDEYGVEWICEREEGWSSSPPVRPIMEARQAADGAWHGPGFHGPRVVNLTGRAWAPTRALMLAAKDRVKAAISARSLVTLKVAEAHLTRVAQVRLTDQISLIDQTAQIFSWGMTLTAPDPRRYAEELVTDSVGLPAALTAGRSYAKTYDVAYGGVIEGGAGSVFVTQAGDYDLTPAVIEFVGPMTSPRVEHAQSGRSLTFNVTLAYTDILTVDLGRKLAMLNGQINMSAYITPGSAWFLLVPGVNELAFRGTPGTPPPDVSPTPAAQMIVSAASAWS